MKRPRVQSKKDPTFCLLFRAPHPDASLFTADRENQKCKWSLLTRATQFPQSSFKSTIRIYFISSGDGKRSTWPKILRFVLKYVCRINKNTFRGCLFYIMWSSFAQTMPEMSGRVWYLKVTSVREHTVTTLQTNPRMMADKCASSCQLCASSQHIEVNDHQWQRGCYLSLHFLLPPLPKHAGNDATMSYGATVWVLRISPHYETEHLILEEATRCARTQCSDDNLTIVQLNDSNWQQWSYCVSSEGLRLAFHRTHVPSDCIFTWPACTLFFFFF